jgi:Sec-independent protein translocase protein TatA
VPVSLSLKDALSTPTFGGVNEYAGLNQGPISTDIDTVKKLAEAVGAFNKTSQIITDTATWKQILSSGLATNYDLVNANIGTKGLPGLGQDMADRLKEIKEQGNTTTEAALKQVGEELKIALSSMAEKYAVAMTSQALSVNPSEIAPLLQQLVEVTKSSNDIQTKILRSAN